MSRTANQKKNSSFASVLCRVLGIIFILAVIVTALPLTLPRLLGYEIFHVETGSMYPELPVGSVIFVKSVAPEEIESGEIISFQNEKGTITHRVVENRVVEGKFITKGDANDTEDPEPVPYAAVIGKVTFHLPVLGRFLVIYSSTLGKVYVFLVAACGVMLNILGSMLKKK